MQVNPLWQYSTSYYQNPEVESMLLKLQDTVGADINMLLLCCWLGEQGRLITSEQLRQLQKLTARWRAECVLPLRAVRRFLKDQPEVVDFREQIKALELHAEQQQQDQLYRYFQQYMGKSDDQPQDPAAAMLENLQRYFAIMPGLEWQEIADSAIELVSALTATDPE